MTLGYKLNRGSPSIRKGDPFSPLSTRPTGEHCVVEHVYPSTYTCDVRTQSGRFLTSVQWPGGEQDIQAPVVGQGFVVLYIDQRPRLFPAIIAPLASETPAYRVSAVPDVGAEGDVYGGKGDGNARGNRPLDVLPGDRVWAGQEGQLLGLLGGGIVTMKAGELAQVMASQLRNLVRVVAQNFEIFTAGGELKFINNPEDGKTSLSLRLGADEATESSPLQSKFRVRAELGHIAGLVDFAVMDRQGRDVFSIHVDPDGRLFHSATRATSVIDQDLVTLIGTNEEHTVGGSRTLSVGGDQSVAVGGSLTQEVAGALAARAGSDMTLSSMHDMQLFCRRFFNQTVTGAIGNQKSAYEVTVNNGHVEFHVGDPIRGDLQASRSSFKVRTTLGDISLQAKASKIKLNSPLPRGVVIGGPGPGIYSAVLYERLRVFMTVFGAMIDSHTHVSAGPALATTPPLPLPWQISQGLFGLSKSQFVALGG